MNRMDISDLTDAVHSEPQDVEKTGSKGGNLLPQNREYELGTAGAEVELLTTGTSLRAGPSEPSISTAADWGQWDTGSYPAASGYTQSTEQSNDLIRPIHVGAAASVDHEPAGLNTGPVFIQGTKPVTSCSATKSKEPTPKSLDGTKEILHGPINTSKCTDTSNSRDVGEESDNFSNRSSTGTIVVGTRIDKCAPPLQGVNTPVGVNEGVTFNVGELATVHFRYGATFSQTDNEQHVSCNIIQGLNRSHNAEYDMVANATRGPCTPGTRVSALKKLVDWCNSAEEQLYWMSGTAGTGKTTLMFSICQLLHDASLLGASFFCSRSLPDCRDIQLIIPTIAFQLAQQYPAFADALTTILHNNPDSPKRGLDMQLQQLIIDAWSIRKAKLPEHVVVVVDALDECGESHDKFLQVLFDHITELPFKVVVASRPEFTIRNAIRTWHPHKLSTLILHEIEEDLVKADIVKYLESQLSHRTTPNIINIIADLSGSLFICAATLVKLFTAANVNITSRLQILRGSSSNPNKSMVTPLNKLYKGVLTIIFSDDLLDDEKEEIKDILCTILCAREPLTRQAIAQLLDLDVEGVNRRLDSLYPVFSIPEDAHRAVIILHVSFLDFMFDHTRSGSFCCQYLSTHLQLAKQCLALLERQLRQNMCKVDGRPLNNSIPTEVIRVHVGPGIEYAVMYLLEHWATCYESNRPVASEIALQFLTKQLLCWIECLSLTGKLVISVQSIEAALEIVSNDKNLADILDDCLRFIQQVYNIVECCALEIYSSALVWIPASSPLLHHYAAYCKKAPRVLSGAEASWPALERVINIHSDDRRTSSINSMAISQDGSRIVIGYKSTVLIWNMRHNIEECALTGHTEMVNSVAISSDGNCIVSSSYDQTIRIWKTATHQAVFIIDASSIVASVSISSDGIWIASGHMDSLVCIWNANGSLVLSLNGHTDVVGSISFIPNTTFLVSTSWDETARIWNVKTGQAEHILRGHSNRVTSVTCSPNGNRIVTGSHDKSVRVWDTSGNALRVLQDHSGQVYCTTFLPDGKHVVISSAGRLRVWNVETGQIANLCTNAGYETVSSVVVFPGGHRIASSSGHRISVWSLRGCMSTDGVDSEGSRDALCSAAAEPPGMAFSSDGQRLLLLPALQILDTRTQKEKAALLSPLDSTQDYGRGALSASGNKAAVVHADTEIEVWELTSDGVVEKQPTLYGHTDRIYCVSFSLDACRLVSASDDHTAQIWDVVRGNRLRVLNHLSIVYSASYSHDATRVVTCADAVHVWDTQSGQQLRLLDIHTYSVTFALDDRYIIATYDNTTHILNSRNGELESEYKWYKFWSILGDGSSYAFLDDGWVYRFNSFEDRPHKLVWVPTPYRPSLDPDFLSGPAFTSSHQGIQFCLPRAEGLITLLIPHDY